MLRSHQRSRYTASSIASPDHTQELVKSSRKFAQRFRQILIEQTKQEGSLESSLSPNRVSTARGLESTSDYQLDNKVYSEAYEIFKKRMRKDSEQAWKPSSTLQLEDKSENEIEQ